MPTWNDAVVHAEGPVELIGAPERLLPLLRALTARHEASQPLPAAVEDAPAAFIQGQMNGIIGVALRIERLSGKRKLSQNRSAANQERVRHRLEAGAAVADHALAAAMRRR